MVTLTPNLANSSTFIDTLQDDESESFLEDGKNLEKIVFKLTEEDCGERLDKAIARQVPQYSRGRLQAWLEAGLILVDGKTARTKATVYGDEEVVISPQEDQEQAAFHPEAMDLQIVFEDDALLVINKPAGLVVHPGAGNWSGTLLNGLLHHSPALSHVPRAGIVHRLDKDTSGLMVVGKTLAAHTDLVRQLQARSVKREYWALVWGKCKPGGTIDMPMGRHKRDRIKMAVSTEENAKPAITHFQRLATGTLEQRPVSLVACQLETGRTHQIRVHMTTLGFPLVGDTVYGKPHLAFAFPRQALQARRLGLIHPVSGEPCEWLVPIADDFLQLLARSTIPLPE